MNMTKKTGVACCRCSRIMGADGKPVDITNGLRPDYSLFGWYDTPELADAAAKAAGWQIADADGPNHRCPPCLKFWRRITEKLTTPQPRGAYVDFADLLRRGGVGRI